MRNINERIFLGCRKALSTDAQRVIVAGDPAYFPVMPKGVEHVHDSGQSSAEANGVFSCDAERRGALCEKLDDSAYQAAYFPVMPKGVEHNCPRPRSPEAPTGVFSCDAERRGALPSGNVGDLNPAAYFPVMPKGVEHGATRRDQQGSSAYFPVMPKGVEHVERAPSWPHVWLAYFPVMPKGVEHSTVLLHRAPLTNSLDRVVDLESSGKAKYDALNLKIEKRALGKWNLLANYMLSKSFFGLMEAGETFDAGLSSNRVRRLMRSIALRRPSG